MVDPKQFKPAPRWTIYLVVILTLAVLAVGVNSVIYANGIGRKSDRNAEQVAAQNVQIFCALVTTLDTLYQTSIATIDAGCPRDAPVENGSSLLRRIK